MNEAEVTSKILQALELTGGRLTLGMLTAHLTSRVSSQTRDAVLHTMQKKRMVKFVETSKHSFRGKLLKYNLIIADENSGIRTD